MKPDQIKSSDMKSLGSLYLSAPDLLSACKSALEVLEDHFPTFSNPPETTDDMNVQVTCAKLRYAIDLAEGRES